MYYNNIGDDKMSALIENVIFFLQNNGFLAGSFLIVLESMIPILPLGVFVAFNFSAYGMISGFIISYISTIIGCVIAYFLSNKLFSIYVKNKSSEHEKLDKLVKRMKKSRQNEIRGVCYG